jgi:hypothetical protein
MLGDRPFLGIYAAGEKNPELLSFGMIDKRAGTIRIDAPLAPGEYEVRGYAKDGLQAESNLVAKTAFTVEGNSEGAYSFALDQPDYAPGGTVVVSVSGVSAKTLEDEPFLALCAAGAEHGESLFYKRIYESSEDIRFGAPTTPGEYEIRGYAKSGFHAESNLAGRVSFDVRVR